MASWKPMSLKLRWVYARDNGYAALCLYSGLDQMGTFGRVLKEGCGHVVRTNGGRIIGSSRNRKRAMATLKRIARERLYEMLEAERKRHSPDFLRRILNSDCAKERT